MRIKKQLLTKNEIEKIDQKVILWVLRILLRLGGHRKFLGKRADGTCNFSDDTIASAVGLIGNDIPCCDDDIRVDYKSSLKSLHDKLEQYESMVDEPTSSLVLNRNIEGLSSLVSLNKAEKSILEFCIYLNSEQLLNETTELLGDLNFLKTIHVLSVMLDLPESDIKLALSANGILAKSGILTLDHHRCRTLVSKLDLISSSFAEYMYTEDAEPIRLLRDRVVVGSRALLKIEDYGHLSEWLNILQPYLKKSIEQRRKGVNIFLYGKPGTGKSQLAKALAQSLECEIFEVSSEDSGGDPINASFRLSAYKAAQAFFSNQKAMILFDEVEDIFNDGNEIFGRHSTAQSRKAWINRALEENQVPTLWLSNSASGIDPAFIRRFDMFIEVPVPPQKQREAIIKKVSANLLDDKSIKELSQHEDLTPAVVDKAVSVIDVIKNDLGKLSPAKAVKLLVGNTLYYQGHLTTIQTQDNQIDVYNPDFVNTDVDLNALSNGIIQSKSGRLCFYGAPGTGKTAYAKWLAEQMGSPLHVKRVSDLVSMWVGATEKNIAAAFRTAEKEGAVLVIDEVDSFLQDRRGAQRSWEITQVNEMLTQMEAFNGVFIASTNLMGNLDQASIRRFDLKIKFDYMRCDQSIALLARYCEQMNLDSPSLTDINRLKVLDKLAPGDFAVVFRQHRFNSIGSASSFITQLEIEHSLKEGTRKTKMGFV